MLTVQAGNYLRGNGASCASCMQCLLHSALQAIPAARGNSFFSGRRTENPFA